MPASRWNVDPSEIFLNLDIEADDYEEISLDNEDDLQTTNVLTEQAITKIEASTTEIQLPEILPILPLLNRIENDGLIRRLGDFRVKV